MPDLEFHAGAIEARQGRSGNGSDCCVEVTGRQGIRETGNLADLNGRLVQAGHRVSRRFGRGRRIGRALGAASAPPQQIEHGPVPSAEGRPTAALPTGYPQRVSDDPSVPTRTCGPTYRCASSAARAGCADVRVTARNHSWYCTR